MKLRILIFAAAIFLTLAVLAIPKSTPQHVAIDYQAACDACNANAYASWQQCTTIFGEGDADCAAQLNGNQRDCQNRYCVYITQERHQVNPLSDALNVVAPTAQAAAIDCEAVMNSCFNASVDYFFDCCATGDTTVHCVNFQFDFYKTCVKGAGCPLAY